LSFLLEVINTKSACHPAKFYRMPICCWQFIFIIEPFSFCLLFNFIVLLIKVSRIYFYLQDYYFKTKISHSSGFINMPQYICLAAPRRVHHPSDWFTHSLINFKFLGFEVLLLKTTT
jgi:hypothetical protein